MTFKNVTKGEVDQRTRASFVSRVGRGNVVKVKGLRGFKDTPMMVVKKDGGDLYVKPYDGAIASRRNYAHTIDHRAAGVKKVHTDQIVAVATSR